jgi:N-acetyl-anhydromuramyl-L-alanine amidase AmpD
MRQDTRETCKAQLAEYGYQLSDTDEICRGDKTLGVVVAYKKPRFYAHAVNGTKLWSGSHLGVFLAAFWFAKKVG